MMGEVDTDTLAIEQYLMLTQGNQAQGMVKTEFGGMTEKDTEDMTIAEYEPLEEDTNYVSKDESETGEQRMSNDTDDD
ncbi:hypothetical protein Tco_1397813, partial [Tanacetum coccineum]